MPSELIEIRQSEKRLVILQAARRCFIKRGFHSTGMAEICQAAGMSPGNLYRYYSGKSAIILAIVEETRQQVMPIYEAWQNLPDSVEGIVRIVIHSFDYFSTPAEYRLWLEIFAEASRNKEILKSCERFDQQMQSVLKKLIQRGIQTGQITTHVDPDSLLMWLVALLDDSILRGATDSFSDLDWSPKTLSRRVRGLLGAQANRSLKKTHKLT